MQTNQWLIISVLTLIISYSTTAMILKLILILIKGNLISLLTYWELPIWPISLKTGAGMK